MMPVKMDMTAEERRAYLRAEYENEKEGLIQFFNEQGYNRKHLNAFLINSLKGSEEFLKEDGLI